MGTKSEKCLKLRKRKANKYKIWKDNIKNHQVRRSKKKDQEELEDTIIIDGHSTVPQSILESIEVFSSKNKETNSPVRLST